MKRLLFVASLLVAGLFVLACNRPGTKANKEKEMMEEAKPTGNTSTVVKEHGGPDQAKLDSLKAAKTKAKKKKSKQ